MATDTPEVDMTPMIDCVFQLITFFMLVINFESAQADERVKLPESEIAKPPKVKKEDEIVLNIGFIRNRDGSKAKPDPRVFLQGEDVLISDMPPRVKRDKQLYQLQHPELGKEIKTTIKLRADSEIPIGTVQELIKLYQEQGYSRFALQAMEPEAK